MKSVNANEIVGNPARVDAQVACPDCSSRSALFEDGSIVCVAEGSKCFAPEPTDGVLWAMKQEFDSRGL